MIPEGGESASSSDPIHSETEYRVMFDCDASLDWVDHASTDPAVKSRFTRKLKLLSHESFTVPKGSRKRPSDNEDTYTLFDLGYVLCAAVYDGHAGGSVARWLKYQTKGVLESVMKLLRSIDRPTACPEKALLIESKRVQPLFPSFDSMNERLTLLTVDRVYPDTMSFCLALTLVILEERGMSIPEVPTSTQGACASLVTVDLVSGKIAGAFVGDANVGVFSEVQDGEITLDVTEISRRTSASSVVTLSDVASTSSPRPSSTGSEKIPGVSLDYIFSGMSSVTSSAAASPHAHSPHLSGNFFPNDITVTRKLLFRSRSHRVSLPEEVSRVIACGGKIYKNRAIGMDWSSLAVTRSLGDTLWKTGNFYLRDICKSGPVDPDLVNFSRNRGCTGVSSEPEVFALQRESAHASSGVSAAESSSQSSSLNLLPKSFTLLLGSDGWWDVSAFFLKGKSAKDCVPQMPADDTTAILLHFAFNE